MPSRVTLSPNDSLWLHMDTPENLMTIEGIMWFDEPLAVPAVIETLRTRLLGRYPVFGWRAETSDAIVGADHWVEDPDFDLTNHVSVHQLDGDAHEAVQRFLESLMSLPLPRNRPLWQCHVLNGPDASAVILRFHHAIADGTALVRVLLDLTTETPEISTGDAPPPTSAIHPDRALPHLEKPPVGRSHPGLVQRATRSLNSVVALPLAAGVAVTNSAAGFMEHLDPAHEASLVWRLAEQAKGTADAVEKLLVGTAPDALPFGQPGVAKRADWAPPYSLPAVKAIGQAHGATVNDVMLAALAGALRRYVSSRGEVPRDVVTMIPINLRPWDAPLPEHLGNKFALVAFELPLGMPTSGARIAQSKARMDVIKHGPEAMLTFGLAHAIGTVGAVTGTVSRQMISFFGNKAFGVTTNVPGPTEPRYFAGAQMIGVLGWVPGASQQTLGACIFSYNGQIRVGFKADATVIPDVANLVAAFDDEMADLLATMPTEVPSS
ncbi:MAG: WS/DGAT domain-containing protein [Candidatus Nanopelagicales bacterium]